MKKIYLAGFEVFELNAVEILNNHKQLCTEYGFTGLIPFDTNVDFTQSEDSVRKDIFNENIKLISDCDIIIANMNTFRGGEVDSGTVFELGYAKALNKEIYFYSNDNRTAVEKAQDFDSDTKEIDGFIYDKNNLMIEGFNSKFNIMINECGQFIHGDLETVLKHIS